MTQQAPSERAETGARPAPDPPGDERPEPAPDARKGDDENDDKKGELGDVIKRGASRTEEADGERDAAGRFLIHVEGNLYNSGNLAGRDVWAGQPGDVAHSLVLAERLRRMLDVFVRPEYYDGALAVLARRRVAVLCGHPDLGKMTAAMHLLLSCPPKRSEGVRQLVSGVEPDKLLRFKLEADQRYVVGGLGPEQARQLTPFVLDALGQALQAKDAYLVLTVDTASLLETGVHDDRLVRCSNGPEPEALLSSHLDVQLGPDRDHPDRATVLRDRQVVALLSDRPTPRQIEGVAIQLTEVIRGNLPLDEALGMVDVEVRKDVAGWFAKDRAQLERAFIIAMSVLSGSSYQSVLAAARRLRELLVGADDSEEARHFDKTHDQRLEEVGAHSVTTHVRTEIGTTPLEAVEFDNLAWQRTVLRYVFDQYDLMREPLMQWFRELCEAADPVVRARAGIALGELCLHDFGQLWRRTLEPWSGEASGRMRRAAAAALAIPAWDDVLAPRVRSALLHWSRDKAGRRQRWTAAAAFGVYYIGLRFPDEALQTLDELLAVDSQFLREITAESLTSLFGLGHDASDRHDYFGAVLDILERRSGPNERARDLRVTALYTFLKVAYESETPTLTRQGRRWPTILWLRSCSAAAGRTATTLLDRCLAAKETRPAAFDVLERWLRRGGEDPQVTEAIEELLLDLARAERDLVRLRFQLRRWTRDDDIGEVARRLLDRLES
jgi:hypothetical protein